MKEKHYTNKFSEFINHELPNDERQTVAAHLLQCADCRAEHDAIKFGANLAAQLKRADAPAEMWGEIENALNKKGKSQSFSLARNSFFSPRRLLTTAAALLVFCGLATAIYFGLLRNQSKEIAENEPALDQPANAETFQTALTTNEDLTNPNAPAQILPIDNSNAQSANTNSKNRVLPKINRGEPTKNPTETIAAPKNTLSWLVETLAGTPRAGDRAISENGKLAVGQFLETDASSRARLQVASIGQVEIAPNSRVRLVNTNRSEHRLSLERGVLQASILAPPRLFIVDTPSAVAVDLGCEYTLEVDQEGNSKLHVTSGYVALERGGRESIVPAGAMCLTKKGKGLGTPFAADASARLRAALFAFDFENGGAAAVQTIVKEASHYDAPTLWHLLSRTQKAEREKVFDALLALVELPKAATREGVLRLDKKMLDDWWMEIETLWFG